jgi:phospholipase C
MRLLKRFFIVTALLMVISLGTWRILPDTISKHAHASGTSPIQHVVVIMLENHTFDNYFGTFPGAYGVTLPQAPNPMPRDYNHGSEAALAAIDGGKMDHFEAHANVQYKQSDIPIYWQYAQNFGLGDKFFTSYASSSTPNHMTWFAAQSGGIFETLSPTGCGTAPNNLVHSRDVSTANDYWSYPCYNIRSVPDLLTSANLTWRYYNNVSIWNAPGMIQSVSNSPNVIGNISQFITDVNGGNLANVSWITPSSNFTDHPPALMEPAQNFVADNVNAIMNSSYWNNTAIFVTWDDWGSFYDHIKPPQIDALGLGMRVPVIVISPYAIKGYISHRTGDFSSFAKFIENNFNLPNLGQRDASPKISNLMDYFNFSQTRLSPLVLNHIPYSSTLVTPTTGLGSTVKGSLTPTIGGISDTYKFDVIYTPSDTPAIYNVIVDGTTYPMSPVKTLPGSAGTQYEYKTTLGVGTHSYSFTFSDPTVSGGGTVTLPHNNVQYSGPEVHLFSVNGDTAPVSPSVALPNQPITYTATYTSPSNTPPTVAQVLIDGIAYNMQKQGTSTDYTKGMTYHYTANGLSAGLHFVQYSFNDGSTVKSATWLGRIAPTITPLLLSNSKVSQAGSNVTFQVTYSVINNPPATQATLYVDGTALPQQMTYVSGSYSAGAIYSLTTTLTPGSHSLYYLFSDGQTSWALPMSPGSIGFTVSAAGAKAHSIALNIPSFDTSDLLSSPDDPEDLG